MDLAIFIFYLITPGMFALGIFNYISRCEKGFTFGLIYDFLIFIIAIFGLRYFKHIYTVPELVEYFNCLSFIWKYGILTILIGLPLAIISGYIYRFRCIFRRR